MIPLDVHVQELNISEIHNIPNTHYKIKNTFMEQRWVCFIICGDQQQNTMIKNRNSPHTGHSGSKQIWSLVDAGPHQHPTVGPALDGQPVPAGVLVLHQPLARHLEVRQTVLEIVQSSRVGPRFSVLSSSADISHSHDPKMLKKRVKYNSNSSVPLLFKKFQYLNPESKDSIEARGLTDTEASITI